MARLVRAWRSLVVSIGLILVLALLHVISDAQTGNENPMRADTADSEIQALQSASETHQRELDWRMKWHHWSLIAVTALGVLALVFQFWTIEKQKEVSASQEQLLRAKDRRLARELKAKDVQIGEAKAVASAADERAALADKAASEASERAANLEAEAAQARVRQEELANQAERLRESNLQLSLSLERERVERLKLAAAVSDRRIHPAVLRGLVADFAGTTARVKYRVDDPEVKSLAEAIAAALSFAKWVGPRVQGTPEWATVHVSAAEMTIEEKRLLQPFESGLTIGLPNHDHPASVALRQGLEQLLPMHHVRAVHNIWEPGVVWVIVSSRPMPIAGPIMGVLPP